MNTTPKAVSTITTAFQDETYVPNPNEIRAIGLVTMFTNNQGEIVFDDLTREDHALIEQHMDGSFYPFTAEASELAPFRGEAPNQGQIVHYNVSDRVIVPFIVGPWEPKQINTPFPQPPTNDIDRTLHFLGGCGIISEDGKLTFIPNASSLGPEIGDAIGSIIRAMGGFSGNNVYGKIASDYDIHDGQSFSSARMWQHGDVFVEVNDPKLIAKLTEKPTIDLTDIPEIS